MSSGKPNISATFSSPTQGKVNHHNTDTRQIQHYLKHCQPKLHLTLNHMHTDNPLLQPYGISVSPLPLLSSLSSLLLLPRLLFFIFVFILFLICSLQSSFSLLGSVHCLGSCLCCLNMWLNSFRRASKSYFVLISFLGWTAADVPRSKLKTCLHLTFGAFRADVLLKKGGLTMVSTVMKPVEVACCRVALSTTAIIHDSQDQFLYCGPPWIFHVWKCSQIKCVLKIVNFRFYQM